MTDSAPRLPSFLLAPLNRRVALVAGTLAYISAYHLLYVTWLSPVYEYYGFHYVAPSFVLAFLAWMLSILPAFWSPIALYRPSLVIYWTLYFVVYIPSMFVPLYARINPLPDVIELMLSIFLGFILIGLTYIVPLPKFRNNLVPPLIFWLVMVALILGLNLWIVLLFRNNLHFVSFGDVYDLRSDADIIIAGSKVAYAMTWLAGSINPFLMAYGLVNKKRLLFAVGTLGELLLYTAAGNKATILVPLMVVAFYFLLRSETSKFACRLSWLLTAGFVCLLGVSLVLTAFDSTVLNYVMGIFFMRTFGLPGLYSAQYYSFFHSHPLTYLSHVNGINQFIHYPYANQLGNVIGHTYSGVFDYDSNAHFWATDGIAGLGLPGILIMSAVCAFFFWVLDFAANGHRPALAALAFVYEAMNITNASLFTTIISGGTFITVLFLLFLPKDPPRSISSA